jgi:hypothetical protein
MDGVSRWVSRVGKRYPMRKWWPKTGLYPIRTRTCKPKARREGVMKTKELLFKVGRHDGWASLYLEVMPWQL